MTSAKSIPPSTGAKYLANGDLTWTLQEARDPRPVLAWTSTEPTLDWYAEYVRTTANEQSSIRLSGHHVSLPDLRRQLPTMQLRKIKIKGHDALGGRSLDPVGPSVVLWALGPHYSAMALSYEVSEDELRLWADQTKSVSQTQWVAAGGVVEPQR